MSLYVRIGRRRSRDETHPFLLRTEDGLEYRSRFQWPSGDDPTSDTVRRLKDEVERVFFDSGAPFPDAPGDELHLNLEAPELFSLPWEEAWRQLASSAPLLRTVPRSPRFQAVPFDLPLGVLLSRLESAAWPPLPEPGALRYFATTRVDALPWNRLQELWAAGTFEIVHLVASGRWQHGEGVLTSHGAGPPLDADALAPTLRRAGTRLLILETPGIPNETPLGPLLDLAHRLLRKGFAVLAARLPEASREETWNEFYLDVVHDKPLSVPKTARADADATALFLPAGDRDPLRISPLAPRIEAHVESLLERAEEVQAHLGQLSPTRRRRLERRIDTLEAAIDEAKLSTGHALDFSRESGGLVPLGVATRRAAELSHEMEEATKIVDRVVNLWFADDDGQLPQHRPLHPGATYRLGVQIGPARAISIVANPSALDEEQLAGFYTDEGLELTVVLFSSDFRLETAQATLRLPRPPEASEELEFHFTAPHRPGTAHLRVGIYLRQNLLQSLRVEARVSTERDRRRTCLSAQVDYALTGGFLGLEELPARSISFATNRQGSNHSFYVHGDGLDRQIDLRDLAAGVADARRQMSEVCAGPDVERPKYQFDRENRGSERGLKQQLQGLAEMGYLLYTDFVIAQDEGFEAELQKALGRSALIQVAITDASSHVFPWNLVYDKPLEIGDNRVCRRFLQDLADGTDLAHQTCLVDGCAETSLKVICPSGFWGFRHLIEQPLSIQKEGPGPAGNVVLSIDAPNPVPCLVGFSQRLRDIDDHEGELRGLGHLRLDIKRTKGAIGSALQRQDLGIVYLYCHGGRRSSRTWLGIGGKNERIYTSDLHAWKVRWPRIHPLVFINGCETAAVTPDDLLPFNRILARSRAAGVIGTEISIPERLARFCGRKILHAFVEEAQDAGTALRSLRLTLLQRYNPLGLAYTGYCSANLHLN